MPIMSAASGMRAYSDAGPAWFESRAPTHATPAVFAFPTAISAAFVITRWPIALSPSRSAIAGRSATMRMSGARLMPPARIRFAYGTRRIAPWPSEPCRSASAISAPVMRASEAGMPTHASAVATKSDSAPKSTRGGAAPRSSIGMHPRFAPEAERFVDGTIGEAEEHALLSRREGHRLPRRHDEVVARREVEALAGDGDRAGAFDHRIDGTVGRAIGLCREALRQKLQRGADRGHRPSARRRVDVPQLRAEPWIDVAGALELRERRARAVVRIAEDRRRRAIRRCVIERQHVGAVARETRPLGPRDLLRARDVVLGE